MKKEIATKTDNNNYLRYIAIVIGILNVITVNNPYAAYGLIGIELVTLAIFLIQKKYTDYIGFYCISFCLCMEFGSFLNSSVFYSMKNTRLLGVNLGIWTLVPIASLGILNAGQIFGNGKYEPIIKYTRKLLYLMVIAVFMGIITILLNDNDIQQLPNLLSSLINEIYSSFVITAFAVFSILYIYRYGQLEIVRINNYIVAIIFGTMAQLITSSTLGIYGFYAGIRTLLVCTLSFITPMFPVVLTFFYVNKNAGVKITIFDVLMSLYCLAITVVNNANGKMIIMTIACPILIFMIIKERYEKAWMIFLPFIPIVVYTILKFLTQQSSESLLLNSKFDQVKSLFGLSGGNWLDAMRRSPKYRVGEFLNVIIEYIKKPWYILFGKGVLGTIRDYTNSFEGRYKEGTFSDGEWSIGAFYAMHFVPASYLLWNGIIGLHFYISTIIENFRQSSRNCFLFVGTIWFAVFFGYSSTLTVYGITMLLLGYIEIESKVVKFDHYYNI